MQLTGADILIRTLIEQGCDTVFGYPGGQILNVYDSLYKYQNEIRHMLTAHEQGAAHAADGYARATGKVGVVMSTSGPGATNLVTGIATAYLDSIPLVAICGNVPTTQIGTDSFQEIDITGVTLPITKHNYFVGSVENLADTIREAFALAQSGRPGPVLIDVPKDVQTAVCDYEPQAPVQPEERHAAKDVRIKEAAALINVSKRPFIYFGGGLITSEAQEEMLALAEKIDAPIGCSLMGLSGIPTDHPRFLGMQGMHGHYASSMAMHDADLIISLGVRFNDRVTGNREKFAKLAQIIHIDVDGSELSKTVNSACGLRGDVKLTLQKLIPLVNAEQKPDWEKAVKALKETENDYLDIRPGLTPRNAIMTLNKHLGENTAVATDVGQHQMWAAQYIRHTKSRGFITSGGLGTMGFGYGAAIGAQMALGRDQRVVMFTGDGSFHMNLNEACTAVSYELPIITVIFNNQVLGMVRQWQTAFYGKRFSQTDPHRKTNFVKLAEGFGAKGYRAATPAEFKAAFADAMKQKGPSWIDCRIGKDEKVLPMIPGGGTVNDIIME